MIVTLQIFVCFCAFLWKKKSEWSKPVFLESVVISFIETEHNKEIKKFLRECVKRILCALGWENKGKKVEE